MSLEQVLAFLLLGFAGGVVTVGFSVVACCAWMWWRERCERCEYERVMRQAMLAQPHVLDVERREA